MIPVCLRQPSDNRSAPVIKDAGSDGPSHGSQTISAAARRNLAQLHRGCGLKPLGGFMQPLGFCSRRRVPKAKWNVQSLLRRQICQEWFRPGVFSRYVLILFGMVGAFLIFPLAKAILQNYATVSDSAAPSETGEVAAAPAEKTVPQTPAAKTPAPVEPKSAADRSAAVSIENLLARYHVDKSMLTRAARAIVASGNKHQVDPRLLASIMIVESGAQPYAVSEAGAIGIMQIHLPTWGAVADEQGMNLFKVEDNVDMGARILRDYIVESGIWEGVMRYKGWSPDNPASQQAARDYASKVRQIYDS